MSQYLEFYIRGKDNQFYPIAEYCRSSSYFQAFNEYVPSYDGLGAITEQTLGYVRSDVRKQIQELKQFIKREQAHKQDILQANNSFEEKMDAICDSDQYIEETEDEIRTWEAVDYFIDFLYGIIESVSYRSDFEGSEDKYLYAGIEPMVNKDKTEITDEERKEWKLW